MTELKFLHTHIGNMEAAVELINRFYWGIEIKEVIDSNQKKKWIATSGEKAVLITTDKDTLDAFIYGMALAYSIIPDKYVKDFRKTFKEDK